MVLAAALPPAPTRRVVDESHVLPAEASARIEALLTAHERATTDQVIVAIYPSLQGEELEDWASRVYQAWRLGQKGEDNGVLLAIFSEDRKARIEVGYGLEERLPDATASRILRERLFPALKRGDWGGGVEGAVQGVLAALGGEAAPAPRKRIPPWLPIVAILLFVILMRILSRAQARSYGRRGRRRGVVFGPWWWGGGGFGGGGFGGGTFGGGGFGGGGGGGFSGGGGMSGGGGASGSW